MIVTDIRHFDRRVPMTPGMGRALDFLRSRDLGELADGTIEIDGKQVFAIVQRYETLAPAEPKFEYHRVYIDIQVIVTGTEIIGWAPAERMAVTEPYDAGKDICFGSVREADRTLVRLEAGQLAVLYPEDGHAPKLAAGAIGPVMKIVLKVSVE